MQSYLPIMSYAKMAGQSHKKSVKLIIFIVQYLGHVYRLIKVRLSLLSPLALLNDDITFQYDNLHTKAVKIQLMLHQGNPSITFKFSCLRPLQLYAWINIKLPRQYLNSHIKITKTHMSHLQGNTSGQKTFCCVT